MTTNPPKLSVVLDRYEQLTLEHDAIVAELQTAESALKPTRNALTDAGAALHQAECRVRALTSFEDEEAIARRIATDAAVKEAHRDKESAQLALAQLERRISDLETKRDAAFWSRYALRGGSPAEIIERQGQIDAAQADVARLEARIAEMRAAPAPVLPDLEGIETLLADALAEAELGKGDPVTLKDLERRHANAIKAHEAARQEAERAELLRRGLDNHLSAARAELQRQIDLARLAMTWQLLGELEQAAKDYRAAAERTRTAYGRVHGISRLIACVDPVRGRGASQSHLSPMVLPAPHNLEVVKDMGHWSDNEAFRSQAAEAELERLTAAGLRLV